MNNKPECLFKFEGGETHPCWGVVGYWGRTDEEDYMYACDGHYGWALNRSLEWNKQHYNKQEGI